jgi:hypothetical protein
MTAHATPFVVPQPSVEIQGSAARFPVHRIYCVGRNYAAHVREMGANPEREPPCFFMKPADAVVANGASVPYASRTANLHHEIELVVAIGVGGRNIPQSAAPRTRACRGTSPRASTTPRRSPRSGRSPTAGTSPAGGSGSRSTVRHASRRISRR